MSSANPEAPDEAELPAEDLDAISGGAVVFGNGGNGGAGQTGTFVSPPA